MILLVALLSGLATAALVASLVGIQLPLPVGGRANRRGSRWQAEARSAGISPRRLVAGSLASGGLLLLLVWGFTGSFMLASVPGVTAGVLPAGVIQARIRRHNKELLQAWPDALRMIVSTLQAGQSLHQALIEVGRSGPEALRATFAHYDVLTQHGLSEIQALEAIRRHSASAVADRIFEVLMLASRKGTKIALRILRDIADATSADVQLAERIETASVEQRLSARAVFIVPWLTLIMLCSRQGSFRDFYSSAAGARILLAGAAMSCFGMVATKRLARLPEEPRVILHDTPDGVSR